jgi:hypothetical protein
MRNSCWGDPMRAVLIFLALAAAMRPSMAQERLAFWNLTTTTITNLVMAPAGSGNFGVNQCANDRDGSVDHDERLRLTGVAPGRYDVRLTTKPGRICLVRNVEVKSGGKYAFSLSDSDLVDCK